MDQIVEDILESRYYEILNTKDNFYYKLACEYMARTELYDRCWVTDERSPWDSTEAYLTNNLQRQASNIYCQKVRKEILHRYRKYNLRWSDIHKEIQKYSTNYSAQMWIDEWNRLKESEE